MKQAARSALRRSSDGSWTFDTALYKAVLDRDGHLVRLESDGRSLISPCGAMGAYRGEAPASASIVRYESPTTLLCGDGNIGVWWHFAPDGISVEYAINDAERPMPHLRIPGDDGVSTSAFRPGERLTAAILLGTASAQPTAEIEFRTDAPSHLFPPSGYLEFETPVSLDCEADAEVVILLMDYNTQEVLFEDSEPVRPGSETRWRISWSTSGVFDGSARLVVDGDCVAWKDFTFVYDLTSWRPTLYRPEDFWQFWEDQMAAMRSQPLDPALTLVAEESNPEYRVYDVEITGTDGRRISGRYGEPSADEAYPVLLSTPHPGKDFRLTSEAMHVAVAGRMEDVAKYRKGVSDRRTSNFRFVFLDYLRWLDFADSCGKADWDRCLAPAGSRGGPMVMAAAALDPRIKLITMNVPTCNRWDWQVLHTAGWGPWQADRAPGQSMEEFIRELSYFDPSHFAERVTIPVASSWGMRDGLSPLNGQLSMWVNLAGPRFLELRPWDGHNESSRDFERFVAALKDALFTGMALDAVPVPGGIFND